MAIRQIRRFPDPVLTKTSREVTSFDERLYKLLEDMADTMYMADGVGLAAVQVGVLRRVVVIDIGDGIIELINPKIVEMSDDELITGEGCLSFPGTYGTVARPRKVKVTALDRHGKPFEVEGEELLARALCHELEHLDGKVFTSRVIEYYDPEEK